MDESNRAKWCVVVVCVIGVPILLVVAMWFLSRGVYK